MNRRKPTQAEIEAAKAAVARMIPRLKELEKLSPTTLELIEHWVDRLIAGESIESIRPEMDRLIALFKKRR
jgi:hypothetical protein